MLPGMIADIIENNTREYFLSLGLAANDEAVDAQSLTYVLNDHRHSRILRTSLEDDGTADRCINKIIARLRERRHSTLWLVTPMSRPRSLEKKLIEHGFRHSHDWKSMAIDTGAVIPADLPRGLAIKEVTGLGELGMWSSVLVRSFAIDTSYATLYGRYLIGIGLGGRRERRYYIGTMDGEAVSVATLFQGTEAAGIYFVGTLPAHRNAGIGSAMTRHLIAEARLAGYDLATLNASKSGYPVYQRIGFEEYYTTKIYEYP